MTRLDRRPTVQAAEEDRFNKTIDPIQASRRDAQWLSSKREEIFSDA